MSNWVQSLFQWFTTMRFFCQMLVPTFSVDVTTRLCSTQNMVQLISVSKISLWDPVFGTIHKELSLAVKPVNMPKVLLTWQHCKGRLRRSEGSALKKNCYPMLNGCKERSSSEFKYIRKMRNYFLLTSIMQNIQSWSFLIRQLRKWKNKIPENSTPIMHSDHTRRTLKRLCCST